MDLDEIKALIEAFAASDLAEMELTRGDWTLRLVRSADGSVASARRALRPSGAELRRALPPRLRRCGGGDGRARAALRHSST